MIFLFPGIVKKKIGSVLSESEYKLEVRAVDDLTALRGDDRKESFVTLVIQVLEENNHKPAFKDCDTIRYVSTSIYGKIGIISINSTSPTPQWMRDNRRLIV